MEGDPQMPPRWKNREGAERHMHEGLHGSRSTPSLVVSHERSPQASEEEKTGRQAE